MMLLKIIIWLSWYWQKSILTKTLDLAHLQILISIERTIVLGNKRKAALHLNQIIVDMPQKDSITNAMSRSSWRYVHSYVKLKAFLPVYINIFAQNTYNTYNYSQYSSFNLNVALYNVSYNSILYSFTLMLFRRVQYLMLWYKYVLDKMHIQCMCDYIFIIHIHLLYILYVCPIAKFCLNAMHFSIHSNNFHIQCGCWLCRFFYFRQFSCPHAVSSQFFCCSLCLSFVEVVLRA